MFGRSKQKLLEEQIGVMQQELIQTKKQLNESRTLFSSFYKQQKMNGYVLHVSSNGTIMNASGAVYHILGYTIEQLISKRLSEISNSDDKKTVQNSLCKDLKYDGVIRRIANNNNIKIVQSHAHVLNEDASIIFTEWDITDTLGDTKTNLHYILNAVPFISYVKDSDGSFCAVNTKFADACAKSVEYFDNRIKGTGHLLFNTLNNNDMMIHNTQETVAFEIEWPDGVIRNVECECLPISSLNKGNFHSHKQPLYLHIIKELSVNEIQQCSGVHGAHFRCTYIEKLFNITYTTTNLSDIIGKLDFVKCIHKDDVEMFYYSLDKISQSAHPWRWQGRIIVNNELKRINIIAWPVIQNDSSEMLGMIQDLTSETYEKKINMLVMRHTSDVIALHSFNDGIQPMVKTFSHSIHDLLGYDNTKNEDFWKLHPDDTNIIQEILYKMKRGIADKSTYRIKHSDNYWVKVNTEFIPFDNEFVTITKRV